MLDDWSTLALCGYRSGLLWPMDTIERQHKWSWRIQCNTYYVFRRIVVISILPNDTSVILIAGLDIKEALVWDLGERGGLMVSVVVS